MAKCSTSFILVFVVAILGIFIDKEVDACYLDSIGGGCPDINKCMETCRPCYRGKGVVYYFCVAPGGGINYWRCRCTFEKGAPCPPVGPPTCPAPPLLGRDFHRKNGGQVEVQHRTIFKYYYNSNVNVTQNVTSPNLRYP
ncbi:hypothetical protein ACH5RR_033250 [Cinchona calisaya]|uniref:Uncharacterized protein n=1 Tax=Cinchona calisaya TaxID=153742 RepID=A0ABD2YKG3_9GENT